MAMTKKDMLALGAGAILLVGVTAGASAYYMDQRDEDNAVTETTQRQSSNDAPVERVSQPAPAPVQQQAQIPACDDDNIVGKVAGGVAGGLIGTQIGKGNGNKVATIGGSVGGTILGEEYIPTRNVTCR